jgi:hypothetical protein
VRSSTVVTMTEAVGRWTTEQVLALAPDDASRRAGGKLAAAGPWSEAGTGAESAVWGLCAGSGKKPYQTVVDTSGPAYRCTCPSRKFPCKHALGLLLLWAGGDAAVSACEPPEWARGWLDERRQKAAAGPRRPGQAPGGKPADAAAAQRRAERRNSRITAGVSELEQRLADLLRGGLAGAEQPGPGLWEESAARMVDAQAPGLAARVRELGTVPASGPGWPGRLLDEAALLHLLNRGWLAVDRLPEELATTVRTRVGLPSPTAEHPVRDVWSVLSQSDTDDGRLTTRRVWLHGAGTGRTALLLSYGAAGRAPELALPVGLALDAEILPHKGSGNLRAHWVRQFGAPVAIGSPPPGGTVAAALHAHGSALCRDPWLESWPCTLTDVIPVPGGDGPGGWQLADAEGVSALPVASAATARQGWWKLVALSGGRPVTVFGECGHRGFEPLAAWPGHPLDSTAPAGPVQLV